MNVTPPIYTKQMDPKVEELQRKIKILLNVDEQTSKRIRSLEFLRAFFLDPLNQNILLTSFDTLLKTLTQLFDDRPAIRQQTSQLLGVLGTVVKPNIPNFYRWIFNNLNSARRDKKALFLSTLKEFLTEGNQSVLRAHIPAILVSVCTFLESIEHYELLVPTIEIIQQLSQAYPQIFSLHFKDVIDLLVGSRLDASLPDTISVAISKSFVEFHSFWVSHKEFTIDLLSKFITDMFHLADKEKKPSKGAKPSIPLELFCFLSCFEEIVKGIGPEFLTPAFEGGSNLIFRLFLSFKTVHESYNDPNWAYQTNYTILEFAELFGNQFAQFYLKALDSFAIQLVPLLPTPMLRRVLTIHHKLLGHQIKTISLAAAIRLLSYDFLDLRLHPDSDITAIVLQMYKVLLGADPDIVQQIVITLTEEMTHLHSNLLPRRYKSTAKQLDKPTIVSSSFSPPRSKPSTPSYQKKGERRINYGQEQNLKLLTFDIVIFGSLQAHCPKQLEHVLELMWTKFHPINDQVISRSPILKFASITTICDLCSKKNIPLSDPNLLSLLVGELNSSRSPNVKLHILNWISSQPIENTPQDSPFIPDTLLYAMLGLINDREVKVRLHLAKCLQQLAMRRAFNESQITDVVRLSLASLSDFKKSVSNAFFSVIQNISSSLDLTNLFLKDKSFEKENISVAHYYLGNGYMWKEKLIQWLKEGSESFHKNYFSNVFNHLMRGSEDESADWMVRMFFACNVLERIGNEEEIGEEKANFVLFLGNAVSVSKLVSEFWALYESARYCINVKLRTPFGSATQTFEAIQRLVQQATTVYDLADQESKQKRDETKKEEKTTQKRTTRHQSIKLLLQFMDHFEKQLFNAYEGSINMTTIQSANTTQFFRSNKQRCESMFVHRLRQPLFYSSVLINSYTNILRHGFENKSFLFKFLSNPQNSKDLSRIKSEFEINIRLLGKALYHLRSSDSLEGLYKWCLNHISSSSKKRVGFFSQNAVSVAWFPGLILMSKNMYEHAVREFKSVLDGEGNGEGGITEFILELLLECYIKLADWEGVEDLVHMESERVPHSLLNPMRLLYAQTLMNYDRGHLKEAKASLDHIRSRRGESDLYVDWCSPLDRYQRSEELILQVLCDQETDYEKKKKASLPLLEKAMQFVEGTLRVCGTSDSIIEIYPYFIQCQCISSLSGAIENPKAPLKIISPVESKSLKPDFHDVAIWNAILRVNRYLAKSDPNQDVSSEIDSCVKVIRLSRKQQNFRLSTRLLLSLKDKASGLSLAFENAKLMYAQNLQTEATMNIWNLIQQSTEKDKSNEKNIKVKILLKFSKWLSQDHKLLNLDIISKHVASTSPSQASRQALIQNLVENSLKEAMLISPDSVKAFYNYADWCYRQGHKVVKNITNVGVVLLPEESKILHSILQNCGITDKPKIAEVELLIHQQIFSKMADGTSEESNSESPTNDKKKEISKVLKTILGITDDQKDEISRFIDLWLEIRKRALSYYGLSLITYFQFLSMHKIASAQSNDMQITQATLRILRLLVKYGSDYESVLEEGFSVTPSAPWCGIIPQVFARLGHPEVCVRTLVMRLIHKIGKQFPSKVVYPAVVGCRDNNSQQLQFQEIVNELLSHSQVLVTEVQSMIEEFTRITTLWEEHCMVTVRHVHNDIINTRLRTIKDEITRIDYNTNYTEEEKTKLIQEKYNAIMKPAVVKLERLMNEITGWAPETPHEKNFYDNYLEWFKNAIENVSAPKNYRDPEQAFHGFKEIYKYFTRNLKRPTYKLSIVSPKLQSLQSSSIPMPGLSSQDISTITIQSFEPTVSVLPTKTKPKKIIMRGSDGQHYHYLLKGREDLHLDERMMQFLTVINQILSKDYQTSIRSLQARHYAVIPLSERSGLIQWVHATPLYTSYKQWQRRGQQHAVSANPSNNSPSNETTAPPPAETSETGNPRIQSPIDRFYSLMIPALKSRGITNYLSRKDWPSDIVKRVFKQLAQETPKDLLAKELWCSSVLVSDWWQKVTVYGRSVAVMSIVGYIVGLGDRHLDNILIDFDTGEVVHIDYNVCFEKGLKLRVPEIVPFRMTQAMQRALGTCHSGVEGRFRIACEHVLRVLRRNRETLLTLLEAFVYDPLVDWTADVKADDEERTMELNVSISLLSSRVNELKDYFDKSSQILSSSIPQISSIIDTVITYMREKYNIEKLISQKQAEIDKITSSSSQLTNIANATLSLESYKQQHNQALNTVKTKLLPRIQSLKSEFSSLHEKFLNVAKTLFSQFNFDKYPVLDGKVPHTLAQVASFSVSLPEQLVIQCSEKDQKLFNLLSQREIISNACVELLKKYQNVVLRWASEQFVQESLTWKWGVVLGGCTEALERGGGEQEVTALYDKVFKESRSIVELEKMRIGLNNQINEIETSIKICMGDLSKYDKCYEETLSVLVNYYGKEEFFTVIDYCVERLKLIVNSSGDDYSSLIMGTYQFNDFIQLIKKMLKPVIRDVGFYENGETPEVLSNASRHLLLSKQIEDTFSNLTLFLQNLQTIILPEVQKAFASNDPSVLEIFHNLSTLTFEIENAKQKQKDKVMNKDSPISPVLEKSSFFDLDETSQNLEGELETEKTEDHSKVLENYFIPSYSTYVRKFDILASSDGVNNGGKVLLSAFNKLFVSLEENLENVVNLMKEEEYDDLMQLESTFQSIFFIAKLKTITGVFTLSKTKSETTDQFLPIRDYLTHFLQSFFFPILRKILNSFLSQIQPPLISCIKNKTVLSENSKQHILNHIHSQAMIRQNVERKLELEQNQRKYHILLQQSEVEYARLSWVKNDSSKNTPKSSLPNRAMFVEELKKNLLAMKNIEKEVGEHSTSYTSLENQVIKYLESSCKQKSDLKNLHLFQDDVKKRKQIFGQFAEKMKFINEFSTAVSHFETFRTVEDVESSTITSNPIVSFHKQCVELFNEIRTTAKILSTASTAITTIKESIENDTKNKETGKVLTRNLQAEIKTAREEMNDLLEKYHAIFSKLNLNVNELKVIEEFAKSTELQSMQSEIDQLLASVIKITEKWETVSNIHHLATKLRSNQSLFLTKLTKFVHTSKQLLSFIQAYPPKQPQKKVESAKSIPRGVQSNPLSRQIQRKEPPKGKEPPKLPEDTKPTEGEVLKFAESILDGDVSIEELGRNIMLLHQKIMTQLFSIAQLDENDNENEEEDEEDDEEENSKGESVEIDEMNKNMDDQIIGEEILYNPLHSTAASVSTRNIHAVNIVKRVKEKLEGYDGTNEPMSIAQQVDWVIKESTSTDNLCKMYEGWTSWI